MQAVILFNCVPFQNWNSYRKEFAPNGSEFFPLRAVPYGRENHLPYDVTSLECVLFSLRMCVTA